MHFIFEVSIREGHTAGQYADTWVRASRIIQASAGSRGTRLHQKIGDPRRLVAIASWDSKESRDQAETSLRANETLTAILTEASSHAEIRVLGEFEDPQWVILPEHHK